jgi:hypothetical protein
MTVVSLFFVSIIGKPKFLIALLSDMLSKTQINFLRDSKGIGNDG